MRYNSLSLLNHKESLFAKYSSTPDKNFNELPKNMNYLT